MTIREAAESLRRRRFSAEELTTAALVRIERLNPTLRAFITVTAEPALQRARQADAELAAGRDRGPLHGIPVAVKDIFHTRGVRTTAGSPIYRDFVPDRDAFAVARLEAAGAVMLGKLNMHELAYGITSANHEVIGVFEHDQGLFLGPGVDIFAIIPLSNFKKEYPGSRELVMAFTVPKDVNIEVAQGEVIQAMRRLRHVPAEKENDFELSSPDFLSNLWNQLTGALVILTTVISSIGLLVGGIGVMNIMLISVTERTQEIGVRKAIGARRADIRLQFLLEAVVLTLVGGTIGILIGAGVSTLVRTLMPAIPATLSYLWVAIGFAISAGVGVFFGYYPASMAANLDPIDCLRYE